MGIGDYPAGEEPAGDDIPSVTPSAVRSRPLALQFDPVSRAHLIDSETGRYVELHPVDAKVVNALFWTLKKIPGVPGSGAGWDRIKSPYAINAAETAKDVVKVALRPMTQAKDITIISIRYEPQRETASFCEVSYVNHRKDSATVTRRVNL